MFFMTLAVPGRLCAQNAFIDAVQDLNNGKPSEALKKLDRLVAESPDNDAYWYYSGMCSMSMRDWTGAVEKFAKASELDPGNYWYRDRLAMASYSSGDLARTISVYEKILDDFPRKNSVWYSLLEMYLRTGDYDKALSAISHVKNDLGSSESLASTEYDLLMNRSEPEAAFKALAEYSQETPSPRIYTIMGDHETAQGRDSSAISYYDKALEISDDFTPALLGKAEAYRVSGKNDRFFGVLREFILRENVPSATKSQYLSALMQHLDPPFLRNNLSRIDSLINVCVDRHPLDSTVLETAGMYYLRTDRRDQGKALLQKNMEVNPDSHSVAATYIQLLGYLADWDGMIDICNKAFGRFPRATEFLEMRNAAYYNKKDYRMVLEGCKEMIATAPNDTSVTIPALSNMGDMYHELGDAKNAFKCYKSVLKLNPDYVPVLNNYAYFLSLEGKNLKKAEQMSRKTVDKEPDNPTYLDTYAWILHMMGRDAEAKPFFKHAMLYGGKESSVMLEHYSIVLDALGETDLAKVYRNLAQEKKKEGK